MNDPRLKLVFDDLKSAMDKAVEHAAAEFTKIRAGKAHPSMLDSVKVDYYGSLVPLSQVANINTTDAKTLVIQPWEKAMLQAIEKGIIISNIGMQPTNDGNIVRITLPPLTEERRKEIVKRVQGEGENSKVAIRNIRRDAIEHVKKLQKNGMSEDLATDAEKEIQDITNRYIALVDKQLAAKEKELMSV